MQERTNLLFIMADQFRAMALGGPDGDPVETPALSKLASEGTTLPNAVSNYPVCSPHRAMFLTGQHPGRNGVPFNVNSQTAPRGVGIRTSLPSWASILRDNGYRTGYIGKWHLEPPTTEDMASGEGIREDGKYWDAYSPPEHRMGFDFWYSYGAADKHMTPHYWIGDAPREQRVDVPQWSAEHEADIAIDFMTRDVADPEPFALVVSFNPPHQPFDAIPARYRHRYDHLTEEQLLTRPNVKHGSDIAVEAAGIARDYFASVSAVDDQIGRILTALDESGLRENTVVIFTSDHGMQLGSHELIYKNVPFEESMRLPFVVRWPGHVPRGESPALLDSVDLAPTLVGLLGLADHIPAVMQGHDLSAVLVGSTQPDPDSAAIYYYFPLDTTSLNVRGLRTRTAKFVATLTPDGSLKLDYYDLVADPFELHSTPGHDNAALLGRRLLSELMRVGETWDGVEALRQVLDDGAKMASV